MAMATSWNSARGTSSALVIRKSFFAPCSLANGIVIGSFVYLDYRGTSHGNAPLEFVSRSAQPCSVEHSLDGVTAFRDGPVCMQKEVRPRHGGVELQVVVPGQRHSQRDAKSSVNRSQVAEAGQKGFVFTHGCRQIGRRL